MLIDRMLSGIDGKVVIAKSNLSFRTFLFNLLNCGEKWYNSGICSKSVICFRRAIIIHRQKEKKYLTLQYLKVHVKCPQLPQSILSLINIWSYQ